MASPVVNVLRWSAVGAGVFYGFYHRSTLQSSAIKKASENEWNLKLKLIEEAKKEYIKLNPKPVSTNSTTLDLSDANFDFEKYISGAVESL